MKNAKEMVIESIREMPETSTVDDIRDRVEFIAAVEKGFKEIADGKGIPHEEVKRQFYSWIGK